MRDFFLSELKTVAQQIPPSEYWKLGRERAFRVLTCLENYREELEDSGAVQEDAAAEIDLYEELGFTLQVLELMHPRPDTPQASKVLQELILRLDTTLAECRRKNSKLVGLGDQKLKDKKDDFFTNISIGNYFYKRRSE